jgi:subtilisin family serine protease
MIWLLLIPLAWLQILTGSALGASAPLVSQELLQKAQREGEVRVIVQLAVSESTGALPHSDILGALRRAEIAQAQNSLLGSLQGVAHHVHRQFRDFPFIALKLGTEGLRTLDSLHGLVAQIFEERLHEPFLVESIPLVQANQVWAGGFGGIPYDGSGTVIAILDTGVDKNHPFLGNVIAEACFSSNDSAFGVTSLCPGRIESSFATGSGLACAITGCDHGTHVAGIATGDGQNGAVAPFSGVAKGASVMAIQVFSRIDNPGICDPSDLDPFDLPCVRSWDSDLMEGLQRVYELRATHNFAAVNMSLGGSGFTTFCDSDPLKSIIDGLRAANIATVISSGNNGFTNAISYPACISSAVSVGSTDDGSFGIPVDSVSSFSNSGSILSLLAPGRWISASVPGTGYATWSGTSMAAPHVAGAFAVIRQALPTLTVSEALNVLQDTGLPVLDTRNGITKPRIRILDALLALSPGLTITNLTADNTSPQPQNTTITATVQASGGTAPIQFKWWIYNGVVWSLARDWSTSTTFSWTPVIPGNYRVGVWARSNGNTVDATENGAFAALDFTITGPPPLTITSLTADKVSPQPQSTTIVSTVAASGGTAPIQFKWWIYNGAVWSLARDWSTSTTFSWMPVVPGNYRVGVWARSNGNTVDATENGAFAALDFTITGPAPLTITSLTADKTPTQPQGTTITATVAASGGTAPFQFKWWIYNSSVWSLAREWSTSTTFGWTPMVPGNYRIGVWARSEGNAVDATEDGAFAALDFTITGPPPLTITSLTTDKSSTQPQGTTIISAVAASGGTAPIQFKWWIYNGSVWSLAREWSTSTTFSWTPTVPGSYRIGVWARSDGNTVDATENGAFAALDFTITGLTITSLTADKAPTQLQGTTIVSTVAASGGTAPIQFKWWIYNGSVWSLARDWSTSTTFSWTPIVPGNYRIGVWARSDGNTVDATENGAFAALDFTILPEITGTYLGSATTTETKCRKPANNGTYSFTSLVTIGNQTGATFTGAGTLVGSGVTDTVSFSGSVTAAGQLSGTFTFAAQGSITGSGNGSFTGHVTGNQLSLSFSGRFTAGEKCQIVGSLSGSDTGAGSQLGALTTSSIATQIASTGMLSTFKEYKWHAMSSTYSLYQRVALTRLSDFRGRSRRARDGGQFSRHA